MREVDTALGTLKRWVAGLSALGFTLVLVALALTFALSQSPWVPVARVLAGGALGCSIIAIGLAFQNGLRPLLGLTTLAGALVVLLHGGILDGPQGESPVESSVPSLDTADARPDGISPDSEGGPLGAVSAAVSSSSALHVGDSELTRPPPVALSASRLPKVSTLVTGGRVAAQWRGMWFEAIVLSVEDTHVEVRFVGWGSEWDERVELSQIRGLPDGVRATPSAQPPDSLGVRHPIACSLSVRVSVIRSSSASTQPPAVGPLFASRIDVRDVEPTTAIPGLRSLTGAVSLGIVVEGAIALPEAGPHRFTFDGGTDVVLLIDGLVVVIGDTVTLNAGIHRIEVRSTHAAQGTLTASLRMAVGDGPARVLDMARYGVAQVVAEPDGALRLVVGESLLFDAGSDSLNAVSTRTLQVLNEQLFVFHPRATLQIEGHTDDVGSASRNVELSRARASHVRDWLVAQGRLASTIRVEAFGERSPRVPNTSAENRAQNRRVELLLSSAAAP